MLSNAVNKIEGIEQNSNLQKINDNTYNLAFKTSKETIFLICSCLAVLLMPRSLK